MACLQRVKDTLRFRIFQKRNREVLSPAGCARSLLWFRLLHRGLPGALLCAALYLERLRGLVIGHVLRCGHARNSERFDSLAPAYFGRSARPIYVARIPALHSRAGGAADRAIVTASALNEE